MPCCRFLFSLRVLVLALSYFVAVPIVQAQGAKQTVPQNSIPDADADHIKERNEWFYRGRLVHGKPSAELRRRAYQAKIEMRARHSAALAANPALGGAASPSSGSWTPLGPVPLASDATGNGTQDYRQVAGRATAVVIDPADPTGNTVYIGGAQSGVWKSTNAANTPASAVMWTPLTDDQATLSIGALAIQPGNTNPATTVILAATGEADNSGDSYFGLGILRSANGGNTWTLISTANSGALSFSGLGGTRMAFDTASAQTNTVVAAMATTTEGMVDGAVTAGTTRGLYTSLNAGQTWNYDALLDPGGSATDATSATSVVYNAISGMFFAAIRYHGFYSSPDGINWSRLTVQPSGAALGTAACPPLSTSNSYACPIYRAEISVVPGRDEMYAWYISLDSNGNPIDGGIWQSLNGGAAWTAIPDTTIANCGDVDGCGVQQGSYNLELLAVPNGSATDLYAGAINLYKCGITTQNPTCAASPFMNLTHVYGCDPISALAHVHPDQHALAFTIPPSGGDAGSALLYFANDGGIYRALNGFVGLSTGSCSGTNLFDDLNQNLGSMTQFVSFSQHPTDPNTLLGGTQDNGSPATSTATTSLGWGNVLGGDGGYNAIDPGAPTDFYASNPDIPPGGLGVQFCASGVNCNDSLFSFVVTSATVGGDDGAFYFPYILDPRSPTAMLVGTCRVWRGTRAGGTFTALSPNFDTLGSGTCTGSEVNQVRALAVGGQPDSNGSGVVYATTSGLGPLDGPSSMPIGGQVWATTDASVGVSAFANVTNNGPQGSINTSQFPISGAATDSSDSTGSTAYVTVMGFTGGAGHVWQTKNAGASWTDFTGNLPDSPVNAVVVYPPLSEVYVATDVGVFASSTAAPSWTEVGPNPGPSQPGFLPDVAVTALGVFASGGQELLRASTYGRGIWQFNLLSVPDFQISVSNSPLTISAGGTATFNGTVAALDGYSNTVTLSCIAGATLAPSTCTPAPLSLTPGTASAFTVAANGAVGDYYFNVQGVGSDSNTTTQQAGAVLHVLSSGADFTLTQTGSFPTVNAGSTTTSGPISVTASAGFTGSVTLTCALISGNGNCSVSPATVTTIPTTANVIVNAAALGAGSYQLLVQGSSGSSTHTLLIPFKVGDYSLSGATTLSLGAGAQGTANVTITPSTYYSGSVASTCSVSSLPDATCAPSSTSPTVVTAGATATLAFLIRVPSTATLGVYEVTINTNDTSGSPSHNFSLSLTVVPNFSVVSSTASQSVTPGQTSAPYSLTVQPEGGAFSGAVTLACSSGLPAGAQCIFSPSATVTPGGTPVAVAMTISTGAATTAGTYSVTVAGTSGSLLNTANVSLVVKNNFQLAVLQPFPANVNVGAQMTAQVSVTPNYSGSVNATCNASAISGAACTVTPANPVAISANAALTLTVTLTVPITAAPAPYNINLTVADSSSSGQPSYSQPLALTVQDFSFSVTPSTASQSVNPGQTSGAFQLTVAPNPSASSFSSAVTLACASGLPSGAQCLFSPSATETPGSSAANVAMTISTSASTSTGPYTVNVTGTSGSLSHSTPVTLTVTNGVTAAGDFQLAITQAFPAAVAAGSQAAAQVSITSSYSGTVNTNCDATAISGQCVITPANPVTISASAPTSLALAVNIPNSITPGTYNLNLTVTDSSGQPTHTLQLPLTVMADFSVTSATPSQTLAVGQTTTGAYQISVAPNPVGSTFGGAVTLSCSGLPSGAECVFVPSAPVTPGNSAAAVVMSISLATTSALQPHSGHAIFYALWLLLPAIVIGWDATGARCAKRALHVAGLTMFLMLASSLSLLSCGGASTGGGGSTSTGNQPVIYQVTVTGSSAGAPSGVGQSAVVSLVVD